MTMIVKDRLLNIIQGQHNSYHELMVFFLDPNVCEYEKEKKSINFLNKELNSLDLQSVEFPADLTQMQPWFLLENQKIGAQYQDYLSRRELGGGREYFHHIGEAFEFLIKIAPIKKVDGAWLYRALQYWNDPVFHELILIYLEELGLGRKKSNHVCIYDDLLRMLGLQDCDFMLEDEYYHHAAVQLALAYAPPELLPEIIGFNLGYEQLPLHLLITNVELGELGIDAKYFNLHITIDNLDSGHAHKAIQVLDKFSNKYKDKDLFFTKLKRGYALNQQGMTSSKIIQNLNTEQMVYKIFKRKAQIGQFIHQDKSQFGHQSINQWLAHPEQIEPFIQHLIEKQWIQLNSDPEHSPFWRMISHEDGKMYGVFSQAERQMIHDWMAGDSSHCSTFLPYDSLINNDQHLHPYLCDYFADSELECLQRRVDQAGNLAYKICKLIPFLAPGVHHKSIGLWSTQKCVEFLFPYLVQQPMAKQGLNSNP